MRACIVSTSHVKTVLEVAKDIQELQSIIPLLQAVLLEVEAQRHKQASLFKFSRDRFGGEAHGLSERHHPVKPAGQERIS